MKNKTEQPEQASPLDTPPPMATRFSRPMIYGIAGLIFASVLVALFVGFSPEKTARGEGTADKKEPEADRMPIAPDPIRDSVGKYDQIPKRTSSTAAPSKQQGPIETTDGPTAAEGAPQNSSAYTVRAPEQDQTQKDESSAINSPVTFGQNEAPQQGKQEETIPALMVPPLQGMPQPPPRPVVSDDQNMQGEKREFAKERGAELPYVKATLLAPLSPYELKAGSILPATLITGINSDLPGQIVAQLRENVYDTVTGNHLLIPQGTRLVGEYDSKIAFGQERVLVVWTRLIMPNGDSVTLEGMPGTDLSGYAGVTGKVNDHYGKLVTGVVLGSVIGAGAQVAVGGQGAPNVPPSFGQLAVSGAAQNINQSAQQHTNKVLNLQPTIEVSPGDKINVFVTKDMILKPFE